MRRATPGSSNSGEPGSGEPGHVPKNGGGDQPLLQTLALCGLLDSSEPLLRPMFSLPPPSSSDTTLSLADFEKKRSKPGE